MRYADELTAVVGEAADNFGDQVGTPEGRAAGLKLKVGAANNSMTIASGPNPTANLLDMVVLVALGRMTIQDYWVPHYGPPAQRLLDVSCELETEIWSVAARVLTPAQLDELHELIRNWRAAHPEQVNVGIRFRDFAEIAASVPPEAKWRPGSLLRLLFLDPLAGLDPATREMEQSRYVAVRAFYVFKRMPTLMRWQSELLIAQTLATPDVQQALSNSTLLTQSARQLAQETQNLPERLSTESQKLMTEFTTQTPQWQALLVQLQQTLQVGNEMAVSVNAATRSIDALVTRFDARRANLGSAPQSPSTTSGGDTNQVGVAPSSLGRAFDITEYGTAAERLGQAARQLDALVASLDKSTPQLNAVVEHTSLQGKDLVDYAFRRALSFLALTLAGVVVALFAYRYLTLRLLGKSGNQK